MKKLRIRIIDLIHNKPSQSLYRRFMFPNYASIMPQIVGVWCREQGHSVEYEIYTGTHKLRNLLRDDCEVVIFSSFSFTAQLAYALSNYFRSRGIATILGGPHARSYPDHALNHFDYVLGLTDKTVLSDVLSNIELKKTTGTLLSAKSQPQTIPGVRERWEFIEQIHRSTTVFKGVSMIGSFGCPYVCDFCIDADIPYQALELDRIKEDLQFLSTKIKKPVIGWYDPNFGIRFNAIMDTIESVVPPGRFKFIAECSLATLTESNVKRMRQNGFSLIMLGIESWFGYGNKAKLEAYTGMEKVKRVSEQINMIQRYIPQVNANLMFGFDHESGPDPFTLTKHFLEITPGVYPAYAILTVFGQSARGNMKYDSENRVIPFPFHMMHGLNNLNVTPKNYTWEEFYSQLLDLLKYSFSPRTMYHRFRNNPGTAARWLTLFLSMSVGGAGKIGHVNEVLENLRTNREFRSFMYGETTRIPDFMIEQVKKDLGPMWEWLPDKTLSI